ncbi:hypothetical protein SK128_012625 [Halocaridina rubra]|uniref:Uncharacterized protein n=1 Tax=Halocaridina rubra TaxID=373956 RepID=A0AAN8WIS0_HALRR
MKIPAILLVMVVGGWCLPAKLDDLQNAAPSPVQILVKDLPDMHIQVSEAENGKYNDDQVLAVCEAIPPASDLYSSLIIPNTKLKEKNSLTLGTLGVEVYQGTGPTRARIPTRNWRVPTTWRAPIKDSSQVVHAELLSTGQVVIVIYNPTNGFDVVVLPIEIIEVETDDIPLEISSPHPILFPDHSVPWHPTVSTIPDNWEWFNSEAVTPNPRPLVIPEKVSLVNPNSSY